LAGISMAGDFLPDDSSNFNAGGQCAH